MIIETVSRLADETVLRDLVNLSAEQEQVPGQRAVLAQMIAGIRNPDIATLLAGIGQTEHFSQSMRDAAGDAARALGSPTVEDAQLPAIDSSPAVPQ